MSASQGCTDDKAVIEIFMEALKQRVGQEVFQAWFASGVQFQLQADTDATDATRITSGCVVAEVRGQFALDRLSRNFTRQIRGAAMQAFGRAVEIQWVLAAPPTQISLPIDDLNDESQSAPSSAADSQSPDSAEGSAEGSATHLAAGSASVATPTGLPQTPTTHDTASTHGKSAHGTNPRTNPRTKPPRKKAPRGGHSLASLVQESATQTPNKRSRRRRTKSPASPLVQPSLPSMPPVDEADDRPKIKSPNTSSSPLTNSPLTNSSLANNTAASGDQPAAANANPAAAKTSTAQQRMTLETFVGGKCNQLARTAAQLVCEDPQAGSPLFISAPPGAGKTHLLFAISNFLRRHHRMRRVMHLSAEKFTNDFVRCVSEGTLTSFRALYRDIDAFIVDDVQFLSGKKATLREMLYTVESLMDRGKTLIFAATHSPNEISGLTQELSGRMSAGLVCTMQSLDLATRETLLRRTIDEKCIFPWPEETILEISQTLPGDGRRISGFVNLVSALQRMNDRMPTTAELYEFGGDQLRSDKPFVTMAKIERAVAQTFQLDEEALKSKSQARTATEPRMLAMYLSRELTPAAFAEIGRYYGGRSHSAAILARHRVETWLESGKSIGRGSASLSARDALDRIESLLRSG